MADGGELRLRHTNNNNRKAATEKNGTGTTTTTTTTRIILATTPTPKPTLGKSSSRSSSSSSFGRTISLTNMLLLLHGRRLSLLLTRSVCAICALWMLLFLTVGGTTAGKDLFASLAALIVSIKEKAGVPLVALVLPTLVAATVAQCGLLFVWQTSSSPSSSSSSSSWQQQQRSHQKSTSNNTTTNNDRLGAILSARARRRRLFLNNYNNNGGDPDFRVWGWCAIVIPCLLYASCSVYRKTIAAAADSSVATAVAESGNAFGIAALLAMCLLLIPVARHGPLLQLWGWNPAAAVRLHILAGRCVLLFGFLHGGCHWVRWVFLLREKYYAVSLFLVPWPCLVGAKHYTPVCSNPLTDCSCYAHARNWLGLLASLALALIAGSSIHAVRRRWYAVFYKIHIFAGPTMLLCVILHWNRSILYIAGSLLYYVACSFPVWIEQWRQNNSVRILSVESIREEQPPPPPPDETANTNNISNNNNINNNNASTTKNSIPRSCVAITFAASDLAMQQYRAGQYIKMRIPSLSMLWHPFTINAVPGHDRQLRILVRCTGPFTLALARHPCFFTTAPGRSTITNNNNNNSESIFSNSFSRKETNSAVAADSSAMVVADGICHNDHRKMPMAYLDGFHGCPNRLEQVCRHDVVVFVAGGVGITPYLTLLHNIRDTTTNNMTPNTSTRIGRKPRKVFLHWICRDPALIAFIQREYLDPLLQPRSVSPNDDGNRRDESNECKLCSIQISIHRTTLTLGKSGQDAIDTSCRRATYSDLENPQDCDSDEKARADSLSLANPLQHHGMPFTPSRYSYASKTAQHGSAVLVFLSFVLILWVGLAGIWFCYRHRPMSKITILPRLAAHIFLIVWGGIVSLAVHWIMAESALGRWFDRESPVAWEPVQNAENLTVDSDQEEEIYETSLEMADMSKPNASYQTNQLDSLAARPRHNSNDGILNTNGNDSDDEDAAPEVRLEFREGRPTAYQFLNSLDGSLRPGLFACGPDTLLQDVRRASKERCLHRVRQCIRGDPHIALYEEAFEM